MIRGRGHLPRMNLIQAKNFAPNPILAETQSVFQQPANDKEHLDLLSFAT